MIIKFIGPYTPQRATEGSAGYDIRTTEAATVYPDMSHKFKTGLRLAIPEGYVGIIEPRSGLSFKHSIENGAGIIDSDYRGEIKIHLYNHGNGTVFFAPGDRIAQLLIQKHETPIFELVDSLDDTTRGNQGFGHTGLN